MKRNFFVLFLFVHTLLFAGSVVTVKKIAEGEKITYYPKQGESFRVSVDLNRFEPTANYDIVMRNGKIIYFENRKQKDDIYFVFNEPVDRGDEILLKINSGYFIYTTQSVQDLPKPIKKVLQVNEKEQKARKGSKKKNSEVTIKTKEYCFDDNGDVHECGRRGGENFSVASSEKKDAKESKTPDFIELFSKKLQQAYEKIKTTLTSQAVKNTEDGNESIAKTEISPKEKMSEVKTKKSDADKEQVRSPAPLKELSYKNSLIEQKIKTPRIDHVDAPNIEESGIKTLTSVEKPQIKSPSFVSKMARESSYIKEDKITKPKLPESGAEKLPAILKRSKIEPNGKDYRPLIKEPQKISRQKITTKVAVPVVKEAPVSQILQRRMKQSEISPPRISSSASVVRNEVSDRVSEKLVKPVLSQPPMVVNEPIQAQIIEVKKPHSLPKGKEEITNEDDEAKDRIVITKIIEKQQKSSSQNGSLPERMSDRVLGGGYKDTNGMGSVSVKAYSNSKPVSAWIEVYQNKKRVKSFYTGRSKAVKLPAGTYVLKATYRTGTSKQKKVLGRIKLAEGQSIRKKVHFKIGTLNVVAKRGDKPLYVKVEIFKQGSKSRYAYTFSSRNTGIAHLKLSEGSYKIIVRDRDKTKTFNNVFIKGANLKTLSARF